MRFSTAIDGFLLDISSGDYSPATVALYQINLTSACAFLADPPIETVKPDDLKRFMVYLRTEYVPKRKNKSTEPLSGSAQDNYWKALRTFFQWAARCIPGVEDPTKDLHRPKYEDPEIIPFSEADIKRMLAALDTSKTFKRRNTKEFSMRRPTAYRDRAIVLALLDTGVRIGELCRIKIRDMDQQTGEITIEPFSTGRKTRPRVVFLGKSARRAVWLYLARREEYEQDDKLFPIGETPVRQFLKELEDRCGVRDIHPHRFRHTFAIEYLRNGGDPFTLKRLLGHSSLEMVQRYLAIVRADIQAMHKRASPADHWKL